MTDVHTRFIRSYNMSQIGSKNTKPELMVRKYLHTQGFRYGLHSKELPGKPDLVLRKYRTVIFIHGCFWHGHAGCKYFVVPKTRTDWWIKKIERNQSKDQLSLERLKTLGWNIILIWECQLKPTKRENTLQRLHKKLLATTH